MPNTFARALLGIVFVLFWFGTARSATPAGSVVAISGQCFIEADGKRTALKFGDVLNVTDTVDVPAGAKLKLRMNDGSILSVAAPGDAPTGWPRAEAPGPRSRG